MCNIFQLYFTAKTEKVKGRKKGEKRVKERREKRNVFIIKRPWRGTHVSGARVQTGIQLGQRNKMYLYM